MKYHILILLTIIFIFTGCDSSSKADKTTFAFDFNAKGTILKTTILTRYSNTEKDLRIIRDKESLIKAYQDVGKNSDNIPDIDFSKDIVIATLGNPSLLFIDYESNYIEATIIKDHLSIEIRYPIVEQGELGIPSTFITLTQIHNAANLPIVFAVKSEYYDYAPMKTKCFGFDAYNIKVHCNYVDNIKLFTKIEDTKVSDETSDYTSFNNSDVLVNDFLSSNNTTTVPEAISSVDFSKYNVFKFSQAVHDTNSMLVDVEFNGFVEINTTYIDINYPGLIDSLDKNDDETKLSQFATDVEVVLAYKDCEVFNDKNLDRVGIFYSTYPKKSNFFNGEDMIIFPHFIAKVQSCRLFYDEIDSEFVEEFYGYIPKVDFSKVGIKNMEKISEILKGTKDK